MTRTVQKTKEEWKKTLPADRYKVMIACGTEPPWSGVYNDFWESGNYHCAACGAVLFNSAAKYEHGTGWPSFFETAAANALTYIEDRSLGMVRTEVRCAACGGHLGHLFDDGPPPTGRHYCINSLALEFRKAAPETKAAQSEMATFAAGCFWGVEYKFRQVKGVTDAVSGYTGGKTKDPTYAQVCTDRTGHAEAVRVTFDPEIVSYDDLVRFFFTIHDPTQVDRQGLDIGTQYRSAIFYRDESQKEAAQRIMAETAASGRFGGPLATALVPESEFTRAEEYHQRFYEKNEKKACAF